MNRKSMWMAGIAAAVLAWTMAAAVAAEPTEEMKSRFRTALADNFTEDARAALANLPVESGVPVAILPVHGDEDSWIVGLLKIALTDAGKNCVEGRDDPMWDIILDELAWDRRHSAFLDPDTFESFGKLQGAKVLVSGAMRLVPTGQRWRGEVELHATEIATKRHLWGKVFVYPKKAANPQPLPVETAVPLNMGVTMKSNKAAHRIADEVETWVQGRLANLGYRLGTGKADDVSLSLELEADRYDLTGQWETWRGELKATLEAKGADAHLMHTANFPAMGKPAIVPGGQRNLAYQMESELGDWLKAQLDPYVLGFSSARLTFTLAGPMESGIDFVLLEALRQSIEGMDGVKSAKLASGQGKVEDSVAYQVVYETAAFPGGVLNALWANNPRLLDLGFVIEE